MAYKKLIKVSNVCQLLDKSLYFETKTVDGITYTNNGDGTITINGTNTKESVVPITTNYKLYKSHFYIKRGRFSINFGYDIQTKDDFSLYKVYNDINNGAYYYLPIGTYDNVVDKPQLFDLTEMYGAGHEPTTVEEFRQDFPDEMYDYSPHCWLTSYKRVFMTGGGNYLTSYQRNLTCKTKNLFDISKVTQSNFIQSNDKDIICSLYGSSIGLLKNLCPSLKVGDIVTLSLIIKSTTSVPPNFVQIQGQILNFEIGAGSVTFTVTEDGLNSGFYLYNTTFENRDVPTTTVFTDIMIELGDTATDYVPYGHL